MDEGASVRAGAEFHELVFSEGFLNIGLQPDSESGTRAVSEEEPLAFQSPPVEW